MSDLDNIRQTPIRSNDLDFNCEDADRLGPSRMIEPSIFYKFTYFRQNQSARVPSITLILCKFALQLIVFRNLSPNYEQLVLSLGTSEWQSQFKDWSQMSFREDVSCDRDYILVNTSSWLKLISSFGGAPEIPIYQYFVESVRTLEDGS